jgi:hypothetical protein
VIYAPNTFGSYRQKVEAALEALRANPYRLRQMENGKIERYFRRLAESSAPRESVGVQIQFKDEISPAFIKSWENSEVVAAP